MDEHQMNKQIKELAEKAGLGHEQWDTTSQFEFFLEKFAELIVRECLNICEANGDKGLDGHYCADEIVRTFRS